MEVFIPTWNNARTIARCINSVKDAIPNAEIILIDRFSKDGTCEIASKLGAKIIQRNFNLAEARSFVCQIAQQEWFIMVDSDVYVSQEWFKAIWTYKDTLSSVGAVRGEAKPLYEPYRSYYISQSFSKRQYPIKNAELDGTNMLLRKKAVEGFWTDTFVFEDFMLGRYVQSMGYNVYVIKNTVNHDNYGTKKDCEKHWRWAGAGIRTHKRRSFLNLLFCMFYHPLLKTPYGFKRFVLSMHLNWVIGWLQYRKFLRNPKVNHGRWS